MGWIIVSWWLFEGINTYKRCNSYTQWCDELSRRVCSGIGCVGASADDPPALLHFEGIRSVVRCRLNMWSHRSVRIVVSLTPFAMFYKKHSQIFWMKGVAYYIIVYTYLLVSAWYLKGRSKVRVYLDRTLRVTHTMWPTLVCDTEKMYSHWRRWRPAGTKCHWVASRTNVIQRTDIYISPRHVRIRY